MGERPGPSFQPNCQGAAPALSRAFGWNLARSSNLPGMAWMNLRRFTFAPAALAFACSLGAFAAFAQDAGRVGADTEQESRASDPLEAEGARPSPQEPEAPPAEMDDDGVRDPGAAMPESDGGGTSGASEERVAPSPPDAEIAPDAEAGATAPSAKAERPPEASVEPPVAPPNPAQRLDRYVRLWERDENVNPETLREYYSDRVVYYGKPMSRDAVYRDKLRFIRTYPYRTYSIVPGSFRSRCGGGVCRVEAVLSWSRETRGGRRTNGASRLTLVFTNDAGGKILRESAVTLR